MTAGIAWVARHDDGREHLYFATDSRVSGSGQRLDSCPKILTLPRSDCAIAFAGVTSTTYPLMLQLANAIAAHQPARERSTDISQVTAHLLRVFTDFARSIQASKDFALKRSEAEFLFGGYSWRRKRFRLWSIRYNERSRSFVATEADNFLPGRLGQAAFIGDWAKRMKAEVSRALIGDSALVQLQPLRVLATALKSAGPDDTIGGPPQVVRISQHMNTRVLCIRWNEQDTLFGRALFNYENVDYWTVDPLKGTKFLPRKFGHREAAPPEPSLSEQEKSWLVSSC